MGLFHVILGVLHVKLLYFPYRYNKRKMGGEVGMGVNACEDRRSDQAELFLKSNVAAVRNFREIYNHKFQLVMSAVVMLLPTNQDLWDCDLCDLLF